MQLTWFEMKKALLSPIVLVLLVAFIAFNLFTVSTQTHAKEEMNYISTLVSNYGLKITDQSLSEIEKDLNSKASDLGAKDSAAVFLNELQFEEYDAFSPQKQKAVDDLNLLFSYYSLGLNLEEKYTSISMGKLREETLHGLDSTSWFAKFLGDEFSEWENRYEEIVVTEEYKTWFFAGDYKVHSEMYRTLLKNITIQSVFLASLLTALLVNYEVEQRTQLLVYATKKGRQILLNKLVASLVVSSSVFLLLSASTFGIYFTIYDFSEVWSSVVSSGLNWEYKLPYITYWRLEVGQFFWLAQTVELFVVLIVSLLTFGIGLHLKNSYITWILCMSLLVAAFLLPSALVRIPELSFLATLNISLVLMNPHMYFSGGTMFTMVKYFELWSLLIWGSGSLVSVAWVYSRFLKKDVT